MNLDPDSSVILVSMLHKCLQCGLLASPPLTQVNLNFCTISQNSAGQVRRHGMYLKKMLCAKNCCGRVVGFAA